MPAILHVTTAARGGGIEKIVETLADAGPSRGWDSVVAYYRGKAPIGARAAYLKLRAGGTLRRWPLDLGLLLRRLRPDVVHLHGVTPGSIGAAAARLLGHRRIVYTDHSVHAYRPRLARALRRASAALPMMNVAPSGRVAESLLIDAAVPRDRVEIIRSGTPVVPPLDPPDGGVRRLIHVANFWPQKGHLVLLRALAEIGPKPDVRLVLVGDGIDRARIVVEIDRLGLRETVDLCGWLDHPWAVAEGAYAAVHPSTREGLPLAVLEAMMRGLPVVATPVGGIQEVVTPGRTGILVPPGSHTALARALEELLADRSRRDRLASGARAFAVESLTLGPMLDAYFDLYERVRRRA